MSSSYRGFEIGWSNGDSRTILLIWSHRDGNLVKDRYYFDLYAENWKLLRHNELRPLMIPESIVRERFGDNLIDWIKQRPRHVEEWT